MKTVQKSRSASAESSAESIADQEHQEHQEHQARQAHQSRQAGRDSEREHPLFNTPVVTQQMVELSKTGWMSALNTTESSLQFIEECQLIQVQALEDLRNNLASSLHEAGEARNFEALMALPAQLSSKQFNQMASRWTSLSSRLWEAQSHLVERHQTQASQLASNLVQNSVLSASGQSYRQALDESSRFRTSLLGNAQNVWTKVARQWVDSGKKAANHALREHPLKEHATGEHAAKEHATKEQAVKEPA